MIVVESEETSEEHIYDKGQIFMLKSVCIRVEDET